MGSLFVRVFFFAWVPALLCSLSASPLLDFAEDVVAELLQGVPGARLGDALAFRVC